MFGLEECGSVTTKQRLMNKSFCRQESVNHKRMRVQFACNSLSTVNYTHFWSYFVLFAEFERFCKFFDGTKTLNSKFITWNLA